MGRADDLARPYVGTKDFNRGPFLGQKICRSDFGSIDEGKEDF